MMKRMRRFTRVFAIGGALLQLPGCVPSSKDEVAMFLRDLSLEALAAFLL